MWLISSCISTRLLCSFSLTLQTCLVIVCFEESEHCNAARSGCAAVRHINLTNMATLIFLKAPTFVKKEREAEGEELQQPCPDLHHVALLKN